MKFLLCALLILVRLSPMLGAAEKPDRPNIVVFLVDDMGVMDTSLPFVIDGEGRPVRFPLNDFYRTPNMERLAALGTRFSTFYAHTVCSPTRIALMTGRNSARHRTTNWINPDTNNRGKFGPTEWNWDGLAAGTATLPALLQKAGYHTIHIGKGHFGPVGKFAADPLHLGFEVNVAGSAVGQPGSYAGLKNFGNPSEPVAGRGLPGLEKYHGQDIFLTEALTLEMKAEIDRSIASGRPFFAYMSHYAVHTPLLADARFAAHYRESGRPAALQAYATMIEGMDKSLGDLLDHLEQKGVASKTLIYFLGDNGSTAPIAGGPDLVACAAPLRGKKGTDYEGGLRVPFIAAWARPDEAEPMQKKLSIRPGAVVRDFGVVYDLFPTILAASGSPAPAGSGLDGADLTPYLAGRPGTHREQVFLSHFPHEHNDNYVTSLRRGEWKLIYHWKDPAEQRDQLYHVSVDLDESNNLASERPEVLREMKSAMKEALRATGALPPLADDLKTPLIVE